MGTFAKWGNPVTKVFNRHQIKGDFNRAAKTYDAYALLQRRVAETLFLKLRLRMEGHVLDIGCGTGYFHELARKYGHRWPITQLDIAYNMCQVAASYASPPEYGGTYTVNGDMEQLPFHDNQFQAVFSSLALQWSNHPSQVIQEIHRVLAPGGSAFLSTLLPGTLQELEMSFTQTGFFSPVTPFHREDILHDATKHQGLFVNYSIVPIILHYPNIRLLGKSLKALGAQRKHAVKNPYLGKAGLERIETYYQETYGTSDGLPATWNVMYLQLRK